MIIVVGTFDLAPEDRDRFLAEKRDQVSASCAEPGNLTYAFSADAEDPGRVRLIERWADRTAFDAHIAGLRAAPRTAGPDPVVILDRAVDVYEASPADLGG